QRFVGPNLAVTEHDREFGTRKSGAGLATFGDFLLARQVFERAIQVARAFERADHLRVLAEALFGLPFEATDRLALQIVVAQYQRGYFIRHFGEQPIARRA